MYLIFIIVHSFIFYFKFLTYFVISVIFILFWLFFSFEGHKCIGFINCQVLPSWNKVLLTAYLLTFVVREHRELGVYVDKLTKHIVTDINEALGLIEKGKKNRWVGVQLNCNYTGNAWCWGPGGHLAMNKFIRQNFVCPTSIKMLTCISWLFWVWLGSNFIDTRKWILKFVNVLFYVYDRLVYHD